MNRRRFLGALPFLYAFPKMGWAAEGKSFSSNRYYRLAQENDRWFLQAPLVSHQGGISFFGSPGGKILKTGKEFSFVDVWGTAFRKDSEALVREDCKRFSHNSNLIGWIWTDSLPWDLATSRLSRETDWVSFVRQLPAHAPGKQRYVDFLLRRYQEDFQTINRIYGSNCGFRAELLKFPFIKVDWQNRIIYRDDLRFLQRIAGEYYGHLANLYERHDPNHLIFGDIYGPRDHPDAVLGQAVKFVDALCVHTGPMNPGLSEETQAENRDGERTTIRFLDHLYHRYRKPIVLFGYSGPKTSAIRKPYLLGISSTTSPNVYRKQPATGKKSVEIKLGSRMLQAQFDPIA